MSLPRSDILKYKLDYGRRRTEPMAENKQNTYIAQILCGGPPAWPDKRHRLVQATTPTVNLTSMRRQAIR